VTTELEALFSLAGRRFVVTGGTRGIGGAIARQLARAGAEVLAGYVRNDAAAAAFESTLKAEGLSLELCRADLGRHDGVARLVAAVGERPLHGLVHAAATGVHGPLDKLAVRHWDFTFALNVRALFEMVQALRPRLARRASIVAISSEGAVHAVPLYTLVGSSKGALESLCRHLAVELARDAIRVNVLSAGIVETDAWKALPDAGARLAAERQRHPEGRLTTLAEVAAAAHFLCADAAAGVYGHTLVVDGGARVNQSVPGSGA
jgi:NAD(P)-dependent dehydrogenase (short-subunit alcohol dehydrogenase family)